jgi:hypothetical protein
LTGRKRSDIEYFTGARRAKRTYTNISKSTPGQLDASSVGLLSEILNFMKETHEKDARREQTEKTFQEERENEEQRRHERFVAVLQQYVNTTSGLGPIAKPQDEEKEGIFSKILSTIKSVITGIFDSMKTIISSLFKGVVALLSKLMGGVTALLGTLFAGFRKVVTGLIGKLLKSLSWLKIFKSIGTIGKFLLKLGPFMGRLLLALPSALPFLARFAGPLGLVLLAGSVGYLVLKKLKEWAKNMPDLKALTPEGAFNLLKSGNIRDMMEQTREKDPFRAYAELQNIITDRKKEAQAAFDAIVKDPEDPKAKEAIRKLGGAQNVIDIITGPDIDTTKIPSYREILGREREQVVSRSQFRQAGIKPEKLGERWDDLYGHIYDPISGRRKDLVDFEGPVRPVLPGAITRGFYPSSFGDSPGGEPGPLMDPNIPTPMTPKPVPPIDRSQLLNYDDDALMMTLPSQGDTNVVTRSNNPVSVPDAPLPVAADVRNNSDPTRIKIELFINGRWVGN